MPVAVISTAGSFSRKSPVCGQNRMNDRRIHRKRFIPFSRGAGWWLRLHRFRKTGGEVAPLAVHMGRFCGPGVTGLSILVECRYLTRFLRDDRHVFPSGQVFRFNIFRVKCSCRCRVMGGGRAAIGGKYPEGFFMVPAEGMNRIFQRTVYGLPECGADGRGK